MLIKWGLGHEARKLSMVPLNRVCIIKVPILCVSVDAHISRVAEVDLNSRNNNVQTKSGPPGRERYTLGINTLVRPCY